MPESMLDPEVIGRPPARTVDSFYSSAVEGADPHRYPGERPDYSYLTDGQMIMSLVVQETGDIVVHTDQGEQQLEAWLTDQSVPPLADRIPVTTYGANMCPPTLRKKFSYDGRPDLQIVPTLYGWMQGVDAVWHERPGQRGAFFAELYSGEETQDTSLQVGVSFLTPEQLLFLHKTEATYDFGRFLEVRVNDTLTIPALLYAGSAQVILRDGHPVALEGVNRQNANLPTAHSYSMLEYVLGFDRVRASAAQLIGVSADELTPDIYTQHCLDLDIAGRRRVTAEITKAVRDIPGLSSNYSLSKRLEERFSWANPSLVPTYEVTQGTVTEELVRLPEQELPRDGLSDKALEQRRIVLRAVRRHWHARHNTGTP